MQSLGCHTVKAEIQPNDRDANGGTSNQRAQVMASDGYVATNGQPSFGMKAGQTTWYGFAFRTNPGYTPHYDSVFGTFNGIFAFHNAPINGVYGPQAPVGFEVTTIAPTSGATEWRSGVTMSRLLRPRLAIELNGGNQSDPSWPNEDGQFTCRRYLGPVFNAGQTYRIQLKVTWGAHMDGSLQVWIDGTQYVNVTGISNLWYSGSTVDNGMYPIFENYRAYDTTLPTNDVYYGGLIKGSTQADVTIP
jgi:hypothetical protein